MLIIAGKSMLQAGIRMARRLDRYKVIGDRANGMLFRGTPEHIRLDDGSKLVAKELGQWPAKLGRGALFIEPENPWEDVYCESFNGKLRHEGSNGENF
jgi:putative transposase